MVLAAVVVVAAGVWGLYAWKYAATAGPVVTATTDSAATEAKPGGEHLTSLRATRPTGTPGQPGVDGDALEPERLGGGLSSSVNANAPRSLEGEGVEMTLMRKAASKGAVPPSALSGRPVVGPSPQPSPWKGEGVGAQVQGGKSSLARGDLLAARSAFSSALNRGLPAADEADLRRELTRISNALLFSKATNTPDPLTGVHTIAAGDSIHAIAKGYKITEELMASINGVTEPNKLAVGQRLKVIEGPFRAVISKSQHRMDVYLGEVYVRSFRVGLGTNGGTPTGTWVVRKKLLNPDWTDPRNGRHYLADDPDNPIGERWIGLEGIAGEAAGKQGFGIHGTIDPKSVGENLSMGCIRLTPDDINKVYYLLVERYSQVEIRS